MALVRVPRGIHVFTHVLHLLRGNHLHQSCRRMRCCCVSANNSHSTCLSFLVMGSLTRRCWQGVASCFRGGCLLPAYCDDWDIVFGSLVDSIFDQRWLLTHGPRVEVVHRFAQQSQRQYRWTIVHKLDACECVQVFDVDCLPTRLSRLFHLRSQSSKDCSSRSLFSNSSGVGDDPHVT